MKTEYNMKMTGRQVSPVHLIYLSPGRMLLSKKRYSDWRKIQDDYESYMTSLGPFTEEGLVGFLSEEYGNDDEKWGFSRGEIRDFMKSDATVLETQ
jgi:hypothetical protein